MFYDPDKNIDHHRRNLPHWQQFDAISFITFRLGDSIPAKALNAWDNERRIWLLHRLPSASGDLSDVLSQLTETDRRAYLRRFGKQFHDLLDSGHGTCLLRHPAHSAIVEDALHHFDGQRYQLGDYAVMPNHVHVLLAPNPEHSLGSITGSWKRFASREINKLTGSEGSLWQHESFDHLVRDAGSLEGFRRYIRQNPEKARLRPGEYRLGSGTRSSATLQVACFWWPTAPRHHRSHLHASTACGSEVAQLCKLRASGVPSHPEASEATQQPPPHVAATVLASSIADTDSLKAPFNPHPESTRPPHATCKVALLRSANPLTRASAPGSPPPAG